jgi:hypothetical protein
VGVAGAGRLCLGPAPGGGGPQSGFRQPALEGPFTRQRPAGLVFLEQDPDQPGPPGRMVASQGQDRGAQGVGAGGASAATVGRVGGECRRAPGGAAAEQVADGADGQAQSLGDDRSGLAEAVALPKGLAYGKRSRRWHRRSSTIRREVTGA